MKLYALMTLMFMAAVGNKPDILYTLEKEGVIEWQGDCVLSRTMYHCVLVVHRTDKYLMAGNLNGNKYDIKHIFRMTEPSELIWSHTWVTV